MKYLFVIPARGGSKGIPHKNIKELNGKPLIFYSIEVARDLVKDEDICVTTDDQEIIDVVENNTGLNVPFKRPDHLATDKSGTYEVLLHALSYYEVIGIKYDAIVLLQPTSPFRKVEQVREAMHLFSADIDMVVSVKETSSNPYYNCFEENNEGFLCISKGDGKITRRQDVPKVWEYNGAIYIINCQSLKNSHGFSDFKKKVKYVMDNESSIDIDSPIDWKIAEALLIQ